MKAARHWSAKEAWTLLGAKHCTRRAAALCCVAGLKPSGRSPRGLWFHKHFSVLHVQYICYECSCPVRSPRPLDST